MGMRNAYRLLSMVADAQAEDWWQYNLPSPNAFDLYRDFIRVGRIYTFDRRYP